MARLLGFGFFVFVFSFLEIVFLFIKRTEGLLSMNFRLLEEDSQFKLTGEGVGGGEKEYARELIM